MGSNQNTQFQENGNLVVIKNYVCKEFEQIDMYIYSNNFDIFRKSKNG